MRTFVILLCASILIASGNGSGVALSAQASISSKTVFVGYNTATILSYNEGSLRRVGQMRTPGPNVVALTLSPDQGTLFAATGTYGAAPSNQATSLSSINTNSRSTTKTVTLSGQIASLRESNNGAVLVAIVVQQSAMYLYVYNPATLEVIRRIALPSNAPTGSETVAVFSNGSIAFVNLSSGVARVDLASGTATLFVKSANTEEAVALDPSDHELFVDEYNGISTYDTSSGAQIGTNLANDASNSSRMAESADKRIIVPTGVSGPQSYGVADGVSTVSASELKQFATGPGSTESDFVAVNGDGTQTYFWRPGNVNSTYFLAYDPANGGFFGYGPSGNPSSYVTAVAAQ